MLGLLPQAALASLQAEPFCKHLLSAYYAPSVELGARQGDGTAIPESVDYPSQTHFQKQTARKPQGFCWLSSKAPFTVPTNPKPFFSSLQAQALSLFPFLFRASTALHHPLASTSS